MSHSTIDFALPYCNQLNAEEGMFCQRHCSYIWAYFSRRLLGFAWATWYVDIIIRTSVWLIYDLFHRIFVTIALFVVLLRGCASFRRGDGIKGQLVSVWSSRVYINDFLLSVWSFAFLHYTFLSRLFVVIHILLQVCNGISRVNALIPEEYRNT